jgi:hypothetical protein
LRINNLALYRVKYILTGNNLYNTPILDFLNSPYNNGLLSVKKTVGPFMVIEVNSDMQPMLAETNSKPFLFINKDNFFSKLDFRKFSGNWYNYGYAIDHPIIYFDKSLDNLSKSELNNITGYVISSSRCPSEKELSSLKKDNKVLVFINEAEDCQSNYDNVYFVKKEENKKLFYRKIHELVGQYSEKAEFKEIIPEVMDSEKIKFKSDSRVMINYSYFPKWKSLNKDQNVFWATPSFMFVFGEGENEINYR